MNKIEITSAMAMKSVFRLLAPEKQGVAKWEKNAYSSRPVDSRRVPVAQLDRASDYESEGCRFDPCQVRHSKPQQTLGFTQSFRVFYRNS